MGAAGLSLMRGVNQLLRGHSSTIRLGINGTLVQSSNYNYNSSNNKYVIGQGQVEQRRNYSGHFTYVPDTSPSSEGETVRMNFFQAVNNAMDIALATDPSCGKIRAIYDEIETKVYRLLFLVNIFYIENIQTLLLSYSNFW